MKFSKKIILISSLIIIILLILLFLVFNKNNNSTNNTSGQKTEEEIRNENKEKLLTNLEKNKAVEIREFGFTITYEEGKNRFVILITENPFEDYAQKAFNYIRKSDIDLCKINYILVQDKGVTYKTGDYLNICK